MPIKPENRRRYPADWKRISQRIRFERARGQCEWCGAVHGKPNPRTGSVVVLTVAHLDHQPENNAEDNLAALCQKCHLDYDRQYHLQQRYINSGGQYVPKGTDGTGNLFD